MKISVVPSLFDRIPGLCIGIVAVRAADNAAANMEAEAFRRRCCTEANLLLKMDPALAEKELEDYREILSAAGVKEGRTAVEKVFAEYRKLLGVSAAEGMPKIRRSFCSRRKRPLMSWRAPTRCRRSIRLWISFEAAC